MNETATGLLARLKQRKLVQWALAYIAAAFALIQVLDVIAQRFGWPDQIEKLLIFAIAIGFLIALVLAWYHGERGAQKVSGTEIVILALLLAIGGGSLWRFERGAPAKGKVAPDSTASATSSGLRVASASINAQALPIPAKSVAVLPLSNESGEKDQQYFSDGLSEDLITALSQFAGLKVINRDSSFQFRGSKDSVQAIGAKLGVAHLLEGSVQKLGDEVRVSAELVNCADGSTLWSQHYDRPYKGLFALQDDITRSVAAALKAKLLEGGGAVVQSDRPPSGNLAAYTAYQRGVAYASLGTEEGQHEAIAQFDQAIRLDPRYARAYVASSGAWAALAGSFDTDAVAVRNDVAQSRAAADMALQLDPDLAAAHEALAGLMEAFDFNWTGALAESQRAVELAPGDSGAKFGLAAIQARLGRVASAVNLDRQALASAPLNALAYFGLGRKLVGLGQLDDAESALRQSIKLTPGASRPHAYLAMIEVLRGDPAAALSAAQTTPPGYWRDFAVALARQMGTTRAAADAALKNMIDKYSSTTAYQIAEIYAVRKDPDNMFKWLDRAVANRDAGVELLLFDPLILRYQHDPRFAAFCKKVGLPTTTDARAIP
ncbi:MAG TPA: tetratricopeptide repeat protein [Rhodanobacteraceae bacterium]|nr:tetratricopeptide repeat protein [Rhodanobacteraceae bacterium]